MIIENKETRTFKIDSSIEMKPVRFRNRFGIELAGHLYLPEGYAAQKNAARSAPAKGKEGRDGR